VTLKEKSRQTQTSKAAFPVDKPVNSVWITVNFYYVAVPVIFSKSQALADLF